MSTPLETVTEWFAATWSHSVVPSSITSTAAALYPFTNGRIARIRVFEEASG